MGKNFFELADALKKMVLPTDFLRLKMQSEESTFVRFNQGLIRQSGQVNQAFLKMQLIRGQRQVRAEVTLSTNDLQSDQQRCRQILERLQSMIKAIPEDPYISLPTEVTSSESAKIAPDFDSKEHIETILSQSTKQDLVGIYAGGHMHDHYWDSLGTRHEKSSSTFNFDYSLQHQKDKAVKRNYSGLEWNSQTFVEQIDQAKQQLEILKRPVVRIKPGNYRVYLSPVATAEVLHMLGWDGFSLLAYKSGRSPLQNFYSGKSPLSPMVQISESPAMGTGPLFTDDGQKKPEKLDLIVDGKPQNYLVSARSAQEFAVKANGAGNDEAPAALVMGQGNLLAQDVLRELGTGLLVGNLWYLNFSDRLRGRITGMTRFATFWVEDGEIQAPIDVMRFDDGIFEMLGDHLEAISQERDLILDNHTYSARSRSCSLLPGLLMRNLSFTL